MKSISDYAYEALLASMIIPADNIAIDEVNDSDFDGAPRITIVEGESDVIEHQLGVVAQETKLTIYCLHRDRHKAKTLCYEAGELVFNAIEQLERQSDSGILAITREQSGVSNIGDKAEFEAFRSYNVLNYCL
jgi:hypothetical protein